jgi:hypothetical protein
MANSVAHSPISRILPDMFEKSDYYYLLPTELIAQEAAHPHHDAKLMIVERGS